MDGSLWSKLCYWFTYDPHAPTAFPADVCGGGGFILAALGFGLLALAPTYGLGTLASGLALYSLGLAPVVTLAVDLIVSAAPPQRAGAAAGIGQTGTEFGGALGWLSLAAWAQQSTVMGFPPT